MPFIQTQNGDFINASHIRKASYTERGDQKTVTLYDADGGVFVADQATWDHHLRARFQHTVPAQPGTVFLSPVEAEDGRTTWCRDPVIAWGITETGRPEPLDHDGVDDLNRAVMFPTGQIRAAFGSWETLEEYIAHRASMGMDGT